MPNNRPFSWGGLIGFALFLIAVAGLVWYGVSIGKITLPDVLVADTPIPTAAPPTPITTPEPVVELLDYGRLIRPIPEIRIDEPAGALIIYVENMTYQNAIEQLDEVARRVVLPGDEWVYYFDTLSGGTLYVIFRCVADQLYLPIIERRCQSSMFNPGELPVSFLYDNGFVSQSPQQP